jgi:hypothetical protein
MESTLFTTLNLIDEANISGGTGKDYKYKPTDKYGDKDKDNKYKYKDISEYLKYFKDAKKIYANFWKGGH